VTCRTASRTPESGTVLVTSQTRLFIAKVLKKLDRFVITKILLKTGKLFVILAIIEVEEIDTCSQFHQHFSSSFCDTILVPKDYKVKL